jgi:O-antigen/teichoic acid export membrane protein
LSLAAILTGDVNVVMIVLVCFIAVKLIAVLTYIEQFNGLRGPWVQPRAWLDQLKHAAPFSAAAALYGLQAQADQWVAVSLFSIALFAAFSVGAVLAPLVTLCRQSVNHAFLPTISRLQAAGDVAGMLRLNSRGNGMIGMLMYPVLALAFVFAEEIVTVVYTAEYVAAAPVMRVYIAGLAALVIDLSGIMLLLREGAFQLRMSAVVLAISIAISWIAAHHLGLAGAAAGSVTAVYLDRIATLRRISVRTAIPFSEVQDWRRLSLLLLFAVTSGIFAWAVDDRYLIEASPLVRVAAGGAVLAIAYGLLCSLYWIWCGRPSFDAAFSKSKRVSTC